MRSLWTSNRWSLVSTPSNMVNPVSPAIIMPSSTNFVSSMVNDHWDQLRSHAQHKTYCYFSLGWQLEQRFSQGCLQHLTIGEGFRVKHAHLCVKYRLGTPRRNLTFHCFIWGSPSAKKSKKFWTPLWNFGKTWHFQNLEVELFLEPVLRYSNITMAFKHWALHRGWRQAWI